MFTHVILDTIRGFVETSF